MNITQLNIQTLLYYSIISFAFVLPISRAAISFFIVLLPLLWLYEGQLQEKLQIIKSNKFLLFFSLFLLYSFTTSFWSENVPMALRHVRLLFYFLTLYVLATSIKREQIPTVISAFLFGMFLSEIISYGVFFEFWTFKHATVKSPSPFMYHIEYSVFLAFSAVLLLDRIISNQYIIQEKILYGLFFLTATGNLFLAKGRTGQVAFVIGIFLIFILNFKNRLKAILLSLLLIASTLFIAYQMSDTFQTRVHAAVTDINKITKNNFSGSLGIRVAYYITTLDIAKDNLLFGVGLGDYATETKKILQEEKYDFLSKKTKKFMGTYSPHSQYLLTLLQMGTIGLLGLLYLIYLLFKLKVDDPELKKISIIFIAIYFISCIVEPLMKSQFSLSLFILFVGIFTSQTMNKQDKLT